MRGLDRLLVELFCFIREKKYTFLMASTIDSVVWINYNCVLFFLSILNLKCH